MSPPIPGTTDNGKARRLGRARTMSAAVFALPDDLATPPEGGREFPFDHGTPQEIRQNQDLFRTRRRRRQIDWKGEEWRKSAQLKPVSTDLSQTEVESPHNGLCHAALVDFPESVSFYPLERARLALNRMIWAKLNPLLGEGGP